MGRKKHTLNPDYKYMGPWAWNDKILWSKVEVSLDTSECWHFSGADNETGVIFGARKNGKAQMTQARRLVWMSHHNEDAAPYRLTMLCGNQQCVSPYHIEPKPTNRPDKQHD